MMQEFSAVPVKKFAAAVVKARRYLRAITDVQLLIRD